MSLPKTLIRLSDGAEFILNEKTNLYHFKSKFIYEDNDQYFFEYSYERLMEDPRCKGEFKVADGTEDLEAMKQKWLDSFNKAYRGCGDDDY